jgi:hypothetical protein
MPGTVDAPSPLHFQHCPDCGAVVHYARVLCPVCGRQRLQWRESAGEGTVYSTTTVFTREGSYDVSLVDLDEGYRVMTTIAGGGEIGARVRGRVDDEGRLVFA